MKRLAPYLILGLVALQVILAVAAAACLFDHAATHSSGHHGPRAHSVLCAWACQANPGSVLAESAPVVRLVVSTLLVRTRPSPVLACLPAPWFCPRAPPSSN